MICSTTSRAQGRGSSNTQRLTDSLKIERGRAYLDLSYSILELQKFIDTLADVAELRADEMSDLINDPSWVDRYEAQMVGRCRELAERIISANDRIVTITTLINDAKAKVKNPMYATPQTTIRRGTK